MLKLFIISYWWGYTHESYYCIVAYSIDDARKYLYNEIFKKEHQRHLEVANNIRKYYSNKKYPFEGTEWWNRNHEYKSNEDEANYYIEYWDTATINQINTDKYLEVPIREVLLTRKGIIKELYHEFIE